jgi:pyrimidine deaminase RibD-like protein
MPTGQGYAKCRDICHQVGHAEVVVLQAAGNLARGAQLFVEGHTYVCEPCLLAAQRAEVAEVLVGPPPGIAQIDVSSPAVAWSAQHIADLEAALARVLTG